MKRNILIGMTAASVLVGVSSASLGQVAGSTQLGIAVAELREVTTGWSAKRQILGQTVYNDKDEKVGKVDDIIVAPDKAISYAIVGAGGFLNVGKHDVAIRVNQFKATDGKLILAGASREALKAMPAFEYAN
jgi:sporulation protein YlmC with PRC-barrel domain